MKFHNLSNSCGTWWNFERIVVSSVSSGWMRAQNVRGAIAPVLVSALEPWLDVVVFLQEDGEGTGRDGPVVAIGGPGRARERTDRGNEVAGLYERDTRAVEDSGLAGGQYERRCIGGSEGYASVDGGSPLGSLRQIDETRDSGAGCVGCWGCR
jgi:hypothetical protein